MLWVLKIIVSDDSFEYPQHGVCFNNKREIVGQRAEYPSLSGPLVWTFPTYYESVTEQHESKKEINLEYFLLIDENYWIELKTEK